MTVTFRGFNTIEQQKKFTLTDFDLIKRDITNAFSIRAGEVPGRPGYGTIIYNLLFENLTSETVTAIETEVKRVLSQDPRVQIDEVAVFAGGHTVVIELAVTTLPEQSAEKLFLNFNIDTQSVSII